MIIINCAPELVNVLDEPPNLRSLPRIDGRRTGRFFRHLDESAGQHRLRISRANTLEQQRLIERS